MTKTNTWTNPTNAAELFATAQKCNALAIENTEKLVNLQVANLRAFSAIGVDRLKALAAVENPRQLQDYLVDQVEVAQTVNTKLIKDANAVVELGKEYAAELQKIAQEAVTQTA